MARRILVVEDDDAVRGVIVDALRDEGYEVEEAPQGAAALAMLERQGAAQPDLILLDLFMPVLHGRGFAEAYRQLPLAHAPIVAITAARDSAQRAVQVDAQGLINKPFAVGDLLEEVERHLRAATH